MKMEEVNVKNMTSGNAALQILLFTLPIMAGNALQQLYNTVDGIIVGRFVGQEALAAIGTCSPLTILYLAMAIGLSAGSGIMIAQYYGAKRMEDLRVAVSTSFLLLAGIGLFMSVFGSLIARPLLTYALAVPTEQLGAANSYFGIYCIGLIFSFVYNIDAAILRALGDSKAMLYFLLISSGLNMVLDYLFIVPFGFGIPGAAIATVIAQCVAALVSILYIYVRYRWLLPKKGECLFHREKCKLALRLGIPTTLQQMVISSGHILIQRLINSFGVATMSAFTAGSRLESYLLIPALGFNAGIATFTGQNVGAKNFDRVKEGLHKTIVMSFVCCAVLAACAWIFASPLVALFGVEGKSLSMGVRYIRMAAPSFVIFGVYQIFVGLLQGSGDAGFTAFCTLSSLALRVALAYVFVASFSITIEAFPCAMPIGFGYVLLITFLRYRRGKWKQKALK